MNRRKMRRRKTAAKLYSKVMVQDEYKPMMPEEQARRIRRWHDAIFEDPERNQNVTVNYLGLELTVPHQVHPPAPMSQLLGRSILDEVRETDRVLDMGTGSGVNAILAASKSFDVVAVDNNPFAVECAKGNAARNALSDRIKVLESDLFTKVEGTFDLIIFDPPFRWFAPRDIREAATSDENYRTLTAFFRDVRRYLTDYARILIFFGTSGDLSYLHKLVHETDFKMEALNTRSLVKAGFKVEYFVYRLTANVAAT
jgi:release factor glutamine methyltransferase